MNELKPSDCWTRSRGIGCAEFRCAVAKEWRKDKCMFCPRLGADDAIKRTGSSTRNIPKLCAGMLAQVRAIRAAMRAWRALNPHDKPEPHRLYMARNTTPLMRKYRLMREICKLAGRPYVRICSGFWNNARLNQQMTRRRGE